MVSFILRRPHKPNSANTEEATSNCDGKSMSRDDVNNMMEKALARFKLEFQKEMQESIELNKKVKKKIGELDKKIAEHDKMLHESMQSLSRMEKHIFILRRSLSWMARIRPSTSSLIASELEANIFEGNKTFQVASELEANIFEGNETFQIASELEANIFEGNETFQLEDTLSSFQLSRSTDASPEGYVGLKNSFSKT